jgi:hypothetical protein
MEPNTAGADLRDVVRTGLDDEDGNEVIASWTGDEDHDDGTRTPVTLSGGLWWLRKPDGTIVTGQARDTNTRGTARLRSHDASARALGYSLITGDRRDVRPDLLRLVWDHDLLALPKLIGYGRDYLRASGHTRPNDVLEAAAADALLILMHGTRRQRRTPDYRHPGPRPPTLRNREDQFHIGRGTFGVSRLAALLVFDRRYWEACERFRVVFDWTPTSNNIGHGGFAPDSLWHPERIRRGLLTSAFPHNRKSKGERTVPVFHAARRAA